MATTRRSSETPRPQEHTAPAARRPQRPGLAGRWRLMLILAGLVAILATGILITVALRKGRQSETVKRHHRKALAHLEMSSFHSLNKADAELRRLLTEASGDQVAKSLRAFTVSVLAVEYGAATDRAEQVLDRGGARDDDLLAGARILMALARRDWATIGRLGEKATGRWPRSAYVAYARGVAVLRQGRPAEGLRLLDSVPQSKAQSLILRNKIRALLALGQTKDAARLLETAPSSAQSVPWARLLKLRCLLASTRAAVTVKALDAAVSVIADKTGRVSGRQKRWAHYLLAEGYGRLAKKAERQSHTTRVLAEGAFGDPALVEAMARHLLRWKAPKDAQRLAEKVRRSFPERLASAVIQAEAALSLGQPASVLEQLKTVRVKRITPQILLLRARASLALGRFPLARKILSRLRREYPNMSGAFVAWAKLLTHEGRLDEALSALENVLKRDPRNVEVIRAAARLEMRRGKAADAVIRLEVAVRLRPQDPELRAELVRAYLAAGRFKPAETAVESAAALFKGAPTIMTSKGQLMQLLGRYDEALKSYEAALEKRPTLTDALVGRAEVLLLSGRHSEAKTAVAKAVKQAPEMRNLLRGWLSLERWNRRLGDRYKAHTRLATAAKQKGRFGLLAAELLLEYYAKRMMSRAARAAYRRLVRRHGKRPELQSALALVLLDVDSYNKAARTLKAAISNAEFGQLGPVQRSKTYARLGQAYWQQGTYGPAGARARKALKIWPQCSRGLAVLGIVAYEMASFRKARKYLRRAVAANPNLALAYHYLGRACRSLGQRRVGRKHLRRYLELRPKGPLASDTRKTLR